MLIYAVTINSTQSAKSPRTFHSSDTQQHMIGFLLTGYKIHIATRCCFNQQKISQIYGDCYKNTVAAEDGQEVFEKQM